MIGINKDSYALSAIFFIAIFLFFIFYPEKNLILVFAGFAYLLYEAYKIEKDDDIQFHLSCQSKEIGDIKKAIPSQKTIKKLIDDCCENLCFLTKRIKVCLFLCCLCSMTSLCSATLLRINITHPLSIWPHKSISGMISAQTLASFVFLLFFISLALLLSSYKKTHALSMEYLSPVDDFSIDTLIKTLSQQNNITCNHLLLKIDAITKTGRKLTRIEFYTIASLVNKEGLSKKIAA